MGIPKALYGAPRLRGANAQFSQHFSMIAMALAFCLFGPVAPGWVYRWLIEHQIHRAEPVPFERGGDKELALSQGAYANPVCMPWANRVYVGAMYSKLGAEEGSSARPWAKRAAVLRVSDEDVSSVQINHRHRLIRFLSARRQWYGVQRLQRVCVVGDVVLL